MAAIAAPVLIDLTDRADALPSPPKWREAPKPTAWELRVEAANKARDAILAARMEKAEAMRTLKAAPPAPPTAALLQKLLDRLQSAEVRRDVELESIKYKAKAMAAPRKPVAVDAAKLAAELQAKLEAADQRRRAVLQEKVEKATSTSPPKTPPKPKAPCLQEKLDAASARRQLFRSRRPCSTGLRSAAQLPQAPPSLLRGRLGVFCWTCQPRGWPRSALWPCAFRVLKAAAMHCCIARLGVFGWAAQPREWPRFAHWPSVYSTSSSRASSAPFEVSSRAMRATRHRALSRVRPTRSMRSRVS